MRKITPDRGGGSNKHLGCGHFSQRIARDSWTPNCGVSQCPYPRPGDSDRNRYLYFYQTSSEVNIQKCLRTISTGNIFKERPDKLIHCFTLVI